MASRNQPTYDFLTGAPLSPAPPNQSLRETLRKSRVAEPTQNNEDLRAQLNTLAYEVESLKQEKELTELRHEKELRDVQNKAEADYRRAQASESNKNVTRAKYDALARELQEAQDRAVNEKADLERRLRQQQDAAATLREDANEAKEDLASLERQSSYAIKELETRQEALQRAAEDARSDLDVKVASLQATQQRLAQKEGEVDQLEAQLLQLRAQGGDGDELVLVRRELSEQVAHIKKLEATNRQQLNELKEFRKNHKSVQVVEEEKHALEAKLRMMNDLRRELGEAQLRTQMLEDERRSWTAYLESQSGDKDGELQFDSPEDLARAFISDRLEIASLVERLGAVQPELAVKEANIKALEDEKAKLLAEVEKTKSSSSAAGPDAKMRARLERQKALAVKEVDYLRAQVKTFEEEEAEFNPDRVNEERNKQVRELEAIVDKYRSEVQDLHTQLTSLEQPQDGGVAQSPQSLGKRRRDSADDERLGELQRKNRKLQEELVQAQNRATLLETDVKAHESQLKALKASSRTRILELRSNPTAEAEAIKMSTLRRLKEENQALMAQVEGKLHQTGDSSAQVVPLASLESARAELDEVNSTLARREKKEQRLKQIFAAKSQEFREAVFSVLGWKMDFMPNGRVRVTSMYYPGEDEGDNSIVFDGENGTMKVSGGPQSEFAREIKHAIEYWVEGRKEIPGFLAALTLEFYDKSTRAPKA